MRVLLISSTASEKSGWGRLSNATIDALRAEGVEVSVLTDEKKWTSSNFLKMCLAARRQAADADIVHALDGWPYGVYGLAAVLGTRKKLFINGIGTYSVAPLYSFVRGTLLRLAYARARKIFCISAYTKTQLQEAGVAKDKLEVVHLGTSALPHISKEFIDEVRASNNIPADAYPIILTVGAIKDRKGQFDTFKAAAALKEKYPNIFYIAAGGKEQEAYAEEMSAYAAKNGLDKNLLMLEHADDRVIAALYSLSTVFALNSTTDAQSHHFEGFGLVVLEANRFSKPAVGSRGCGIEDAIKDERTGFLCNQRDPKDIARKLERVLEDYERLSLSAKEFSEQFSWEKTAASYMDFYAS
jgi:glycosyltransferase involved in cell wall biosynthesis